MRYLVVVLGLAGCDGVFNIDHVREPFGSNTGDGSTADSTLDMGLLVHLEFEGDLRDSATGNTATCVTMPCPTIEPARGAKVAHFDGVDDCLSVVPAAYGTIYTVAVWMNKPNDKVDTFIAETYQGGLNTWRLETNTNRTIRYAAVDVGTNLYVTSPVNTFTFGRWTHVAASFDGSMRNLYVDGVLVASGGPVQPEVDATIPIHVGCDLDNGSAVAQFGGYLDDVRVYSRALTAAEIGALAKM